MKAKVVRIGNSLGVIIPQQAARALKLKKGDAVSVQADAEQGALFVTKDNGGKIDPDFVRRVTAFSKRYERDLRRLAE